MTGQTAAEKLAARASGVKNQGGGEKPPAADAPKAAPVLYDYKLFGLHNPDPATPSSWLPLGEVKAASYYAAMDLAKDALREQLVKQATEEAPVPATLKLTVAAIASRNWNQGTAIVEMRPVTTWEK